MVAMPDRLVPLVGEPLRFEHMLTLPAHDALTLLVVHCMSALCR